MENLNQFNDLIIKKIQYATDFQRIKFGLDICLRLLPEYKIFNEKTKWGNIQILLESINYIEKYLETPLLDLEYINKLIISVESSTPDTEDFGDWEGSYALNAAGSILELLMYLKDNDPKHIISISTFMTDTIDFKVQQENVSISEEEIDNHPLIISEFEYQLKHI